MQLVQPGCGLDKIFMECLPAFDCNGKQGDSSVYNQAYLMSMLIPPEIEENDGTDQRIGDKLVWRSDSQEIT